MGDWRNKERAIARRSAQKSSRGAARGIFSGYVDTASGETQSAKLVYAGGEKSIPLPMPFEGTDSWIRSIPNSGSPCVLANRSDTEDLTFITYLNESAEKRLEQYKGTSGLYRPLNPGEHEIHSSGLAQSYYASRPYMEHRAGIIRSWLDQDRVECGQKAPLHVRQIWEHASNEIGDEERFGVVKRPLMLVGVAAALARSLYSYNFPDFPYPDFSLPGGVPAAFSYTAQAIAEATEALAQIAGEFKVRPYAKEYLKVIKNPLAPLPPSNLIDFREGQVFDDMGFQTIGPNGAYLRAQYEYYTPLFDATTCVIDELGNVNWDLSLGALTGWTTSIPFGAWKLDTGLGIEASTLTSISTSSLLDTSISALTELNMEGTVSVALNAGVTCTHDTTGQRDVTVSLNSTHKSDLNYSCEAGLMMDLKAGAQMTANAPIIQIGSSPSDPMVLGAKLNTFLTEFINVFVSAPMVSVAGNLGAPVPWNPQIISQLSALLPKLIAHLSTTITVGP